MLIIGPWIDCTALPIVPYLPTTGSFTRVSRQACPYNPLAPANAVRQIYRRALTLHRYDYHASQHEGEQQHQFDSHRYHQRLPAVEAYR